MSPEFNPLYSPYGAYELKASYQHNMMISSLSILGLVTFITIAAMILVKSPAITTVPVGPGPIEITPTLPPPPSVKPTTPQVNIKPPVNELPRFIQMAPVDDETVLEFELETEIVTTDKFFDGTAIENGPLGGAEDGNRTGSFEDGEVLDGLTIYKHVDRRPEFIHKAKPVYPRLARQAGLEGTVWIAVEVDIDGSVSNAKIYKSSTIEVLDHAALEVAYENSFRPAVQNKIPVKIWISYQVEFVLTK